MKTLVIIPSLFSKFSFSAPLAWLFSDHIDEVKGIYGYQLDAAIVRQYKSFIVELNWFIELFEFELITKFIKRHNPDSVIMFGGLYSHLKYKEIFQRYPVDYYIKGDAELPMKLYLDGTDPKTIPNMVGRDFENEHTYICTNEDLKSIRYNMDWIPQYFDLLSQTAPPADFAPRYDKMPLYPQYWEKTGKKKPPEEYRWRVPAKGGRYYLPMIITSRGECQAKHDGCDYCMGTKTSALQGIYKRSSLVLDNETLILHLKDIEKKYKNVCLFINSKCNYDFTGHNFNLEATIEIDSQCSAEDLKKIIYAFRKTVVHTAIYQEGLTGKKTLINIQEFQQLEDENHKIYFFAFDKDAQLIPENRRLYSEIVLPYWTDWKFYTNMDNAMKKSREWYNSIGQFNLYPPPKQVVMKSVSFVIRRILYVLNRLKIIDLKKKLF